MRARLALSRAVLHDPDLLLLDEPTAGLDPESARVVLGLIDEMAEQGKAVVMCTHLLLEAEGLADQVVVMDQGRTLVAGTARDLTHELWPSITVLVDAEDPEMLDRCAAFPFVRSYERNGSAMIELDDREHVADLVDTLRRRRRPAAARRAAHPDARRALLHRAEAPVNRGRVDRGRARRSAPAPREQGLLGSARGHRARSCSWSCPR